MLTEDCYLLEPPYGQWLAVTDTVSVITAKMEGKRKPPSLTFPDVYPMIMHDNSFLNMVPEDEPPRLEGIRFATRVELVNVDLSSGKIASQNDVTCFKPKGRLATEKACLDTQAISFLKQQKMECEKYGPRKA